MTALPNWPRCTRSAPRCGLPGPMADRDPQRPCTPQTNPRERAGQCEGRQRERCRSRAWRCQPTFHRASKRALRDPGGSSACRRAAGRDLELLAGVAHVADDRLHTRRGLGSMMMVILARSGYESPDLRATRRQQVSTARRERSERDTQAAHRCSEPSAGVLWPRPSRLHLDGLAWPRRG